jgi:3-oxoacyl-[acyl-carrier-protein] synthase-1/3-oxoacyl-[acyl-carrier-protein] synthase II
MSDICVLAVGAVSALGIGPDAYRTAFEGEPARVALGPDAALESAKLARPFAGRAPADLGAEKSDDRATDLLVCALSQVTEALDATRPSWRAERLGVAMGTSSGGMLTATRFFEARAGGKAPEEVADIARGATYFAPFERALEVAGLAACEKRTQILAACSASTIAIGIAMRWLERDACDLVLAGGYDGVSVFVAAGFEALRATTASRPRPFRVGRDGMSLGEGAGVIALTRPSEARGSRVLFRLAGFGASTDAVHITAPDRTGAGLLRAASAALSDAGFSASKVGLVSAHATATPYNDAMEARAINALFEGEPQPVVHPFKAQIGHTLGAAGVLETLAAADALARDVAPAAAGDGEIDPSASVTLLERGERREMEAALKLSAAFGGANASLVITHDRRGSVHKLARPVFVRAFAHVTSADLDALAAATGAPKDRLARLDPLCRLGLAAVAELAAKVGRPNIQGAGIVAGHGLATLDTNDLFDARRRTRGATFVEPRLFPATSPNAIAGECAILYQLTGPSFATGSGLDGAKEALVDAAELVSAGDADRIVVVAADDAGPAARDLLLAAGWQHRPLARGAVALLIVPDPSGAIRQVDLEMQIDHADSPVGHLSLLRWLGVSS